MKNLSPKILVIVLGMHRSGTSAITRGLQALGVDLGNNLMPGVASDNSKGYWEDLDFNQLNIELLHKLDRQWDSLSPIEDVDFELDSLAEIKIRAVTLVQEKMANSPIVGIKDPRLPRLLPFWNTIFEQVGLEVRVVIAARNPLSVANSLEARNGFSNEKSYYLWLGHVIPAVIHTSRFLRVVVDYDNLIDNPLGQLKRISEKLNLSAPDKPSDSAREYTEDFIENNLRHTRYYPKDLLLVPSVPKSVQKASNLLNQAANDLIPLDTEFQESFSELQEELLTLKPAFTYMDRLEYTFSEKVQAVEALSSQIDNLNQSIGHRKSQIDDLEHIVADRDTRINDLDKAVTDRDTRISELSLSVADRNIRINDLDKAVTERNEQIAGLNQTTSILGHQITEIFSSTSWKITSPLRRLKKIKQEVINSVSTTTFAAKRQDM
jgi:hypothetical protein